MPVIDYTGKAFRGEKLRTIEIANDICAQYAGEGFDLTLRQLYYQFVSRALIPNKQSEYNRLGTIINDARMAGYMDWDYIVDRTRNLKTVAHWNSPEEIVDVVAKQFKMDRWASQDHYVEVWIEKDALVGVLAQVCPRLDVPYFSCRGYTSQSEMWGAAQRLGRKIVEGKSAVIIHLGDHDPSGVDMSRDIEARLAKFIAQDLDVAGSDETAEDYSYALSMGAYGFDEFTDSPFQVERVALNMDQIRRYNPPPNPAKFTDSRAVGYVSKYGRSSWELDALEPSVLTALIESSVGYYRDEDRWEKATREQENQKLMLAAISRHWDDVAETVSNTWPDEVKFDEADDE